MKSSLRSLCKTTGSEKGLITMVELVIVSCLLLLVLSVAYEFFYQYNRNWRFTSARAEQTQNARQALDLLVHDLRQAKSPDEVNPMIQLANPLEITFYADVNRATGPERVRFFIQSGRLMREFLSPSSQSAPWVYSGTPTQETVARGIQNDLSNPLFTYYDEDGNLLNPQTQIDRDNIWRVKILITNLDEKAVQTAFKLESDVRLRNAK